MEGSKLNLEIISSCKLPRIVRLMFNELLSHSHYCKIFNINFHCKFSLIWKIWHNQDDNLHQEGEDTMRHKEDFNKGSSS